MLVAPEHRPTLREELAPLPAPARWGVIAVLVLVVIASIVALTGSSTADGKVIVRRDPIAFNLRVPPGMQEVTARRRASWCTSQREGKDSFVVKPLELPAYRGDVGGILPVAAARELDALRERFPDLEVVEEGKGRINQAAAYSIVFRASRNPRLYGRLVLLPEPVPGARDGVKLLLLANPAGGAGKAATSAPADSSRRPIAASASARRARERQIDFDQFLAVDMRVGRITAVEDFPEARKPAWKLTIDFGEELGSKRSSAQVTNYTREELEGRLVVAVVNFPPRQIGPVRSEVLVLGAADEAGRVILLAPDSDVPLGARIH